MILIYTLRLEYVTQDCIVTSRKITLNNI